VGSTMPRLESSFRPRLKPDGSYEPQQAMSAVPAILTVPRSDPMLRTTRRTDVHSNVIYTPLKAPCTPLKTSPTPPAGTAQAAQATATPSTTGDQQQVDGSGTKQASLARMWEDALARTSRRQARESDSLPTSRPAIIPSVKQLDFEAQPSLGEVAEQPATTARTAVLPSPTGSLVPRVVKAGETIPPPMVALQVPGAKSWVQKAAQPIVARAASVQAPVHVPGHTQGQKAAQPITSRTMSLQVPVGHPQGLQAPRSSAPRAASMQVPAGPLHLVPSTGASARAPMGQLQVAAQHLSNSQRPETSLWPTKLRPEAALKPSVAQLEVPPPLSAKVLGLLPKPLNDTGSSTETLPLAETALSAHDLRQIPTPTHSFQKLNEIIDDHCVRVATY